MQTLLTLIVTWLSINFGLPATEARPHVEFVSAARMADVRYSRLASNLPESAAVVTDGSDPPDYFRNVHAIYDDESGTIYLPTGWSANSPADVSMLVHEMVHHLQNVGGLRYGCPQMRERPAYRAQARWLDLFGTTLADEFGIDATTVLVRTNCMP
jgi:hypothetical protein